TPLGVEGSENHAASRSVPREAEDTPRLQARATQEPLQTPAQNTPRQGAVDSPQQVKAESDIDAIRREGFTGRQLRMARRMAQ
ncbi:MAG: capsule biosynthesis protein, partial [Lentibacter algarum]